jgi:hypothetical protein
MKTTLPLDETLVNRASQLPGVEETNRLIHLAPEMLILRESSKRLAALSGSEKKLRPAPRRRGR